MRRFFMVMNYLPKGTGLGVSLLDGGRIGSSTLGCSPVSDLRKDTIS